MNRNEEGNLVRPNGGTTDIGTMLTMAEGWITGLGDAARGTLEKGVQRIEDAQTAVFERGGEVATATDDYVHEHPWRSVGIAAAVGLVVGLWIARR